MPQAAERKLVVTEVGRHRTSGHDEAVVGEGGPGTAELGGRDRARRRIDGLHLAQDHPERRMVTQHIADGRGDLTLREDPRGHLVEQGLEQMMIGAIDQSDPDRYPAQRLGGKQSAEPAADDHHVVAGVFRCRAHRNLATTSST